MPIYPTLSPSYNSEYNTYWGCEGAETSIHSLWQSEPFAVQTIWLQNQSDYCYQIYTTIIQGHNLPLYVIKILSGTFKEAIHEFFTLTL